MSIYKLNVYTSVVKDLQRNDRNSTFLEILGECNGDIIEAIELLHSCLDRIVNEEGLEGEEIRFYIKQLNRVAELRN